LRRKLCLLRHGGVRNLREFGEKLPKVIPKWDMHLGCFKIESRCAQNSEIQLRENLGASDSGLRSHRKFATLPPVATTVAGSR